MRSGNQQRRSAKRNCWTNSVPYGYGGRIADMSVLPVRIIMSPTCSSRFFVGKNALSATARTNCPPLSGLNTTPVTGGVRQEMHSGNVVPPMKLVHASSGRLQWYLGRALSGRNVHRAVPVALACAGLIVTGCGSSGERQDKNEPSGDFKVEVVEAKFPDKQSLAKRSQMVITVKNVDTKTIPNAA